MSSKIKFQTEALAFLLAAANLWLFFERVASALMFGTKVSTAAFRSSVENEFGSFPIRLSRWCDLSQ